jgi:hypothetical protein
MMIGMTVLFSLFFWFRFRARGEMQQTIRAAIEKGQELSPEIIERLGNPKRPRDKDLRLALIWLASAVGLFLFGAAIAAAETEEHIFTIFSGISAFPLMIGIAYLVMWRFTDYD